MTRDEYLAPPKSPPDLDIPKSSTTVKVAIIETTSKIQLPMKLMTKPEVGGFKTVTAPAFSFLIEHSSGRKVIFDLGVRKDWENSPKPIVDAISQSGGKIEVEKDVAQLLNENGVALDNIEAIIWSHYHFDHTGDPSTFPYSTALFTGPGVKERFPKAYPSDPDAHLSESAWEDREWKEISFDATNLKIGRFRAFDYFNDGSFYLLDAPGHLLGHICGLARTTSDSFIVMGADAAHYAAEIRPTEYLPLPKQISLDPIIKSIPCPCPGEMLQNHIHPEKSASSPFYKAADGCNETSEIADWTTEGVEEFDADDRVFVVIAHDQTLLDVVDFYPKYANNWKELQWAEKGRWRFIKDFESSIEESYKNK